MQKRLVLHDMLLMIIDDSGFVLEMIERIM